MKVITTGEIKVHTKTFFELAETERVSVKRGKDKYVNLIVTDAPDKVFVDEDWIKKFMSIPAEYRCDPFEISSSGDLFYADKRNVEEVSKRINDIRTGKSKIAATLSSEDDIKNFINSI